MAKVFDIPRYKNQTACKLRLLLDMSDAGSDGLIFFDEAVARWEPAIVEREMALLGDLDVAFDGPVNLIDFSDYETDEIAYKRYAYATGLLEVKRGHDEDAVVFANSIRNVLSPKYVIYTDCCAANKMLGMLIDGSIQVHVFGRFRDAQDAVANDLSTCIMHSLAACKLGASCAAASAKCEHPWSTYADNDMWAAFLMFEKMIMGASTPKMVQAHKDVNSGNVTIGGSDFIDHTNVIERMSNIETYTKVLGLHIVMAQGCCFVLDHSIIQQLMECARGFQMARVYYSNYRISDDDFQIRPALVRINLEIDAWCAAIMNQNPKTETIAKYMKQMIAVKMNSFRSIHEKFDTGAAERHMALMAELVAAEPGIARFPTSIDTIPEHIAFEMLHKFVCIPAPDADPSILFDKTINALSHSNYVEQEVWNRFMAYTQSLDLILALQKFGDSLIMDQKPGVNFINSNAYHDVKNRRVNALPQQYMGNVRVKNFFNFESRIENWFWDVGDVTHILPDSNIYRSHARHNELSREISNELLYAIAYAPLLGIKYYPSDIRGMLDSGNIPLSMPLVIAAKSENTKTSLKTRETYSANDVLREVTAEFDRAAVPLASLYEASTMRKGSDNLSKSINRIIEATQSTHGAVVISLDVSGWSPNANREKFLEHHRYVLETTNVTGPYKIESFWNKIEVIINKRGWIKSSNARTGMFQGFTGSMDTMLHVHIAYFCISEGKRLGIIRKDEAAIVLAMIDDGVICLPFAAGRSAESKREVSGVFFKHIVTTYKSLGLNIDTDKTIVSTNNFVFLNRFYSGNHEVLTALKVFTKLDREHDKMFGGTIAQCRTIFENGRNAMGRGADPIAVYTTSMALCLRIIFITCKRLTTLNVLELSCICFTPSSLGGIGFPTIAQVACSECPDIICSYIGGMKETARYIHDIRAKSIFDRVLSNVINQELRMPRANLHMSTPMTVRVSGFTDPEMSAQSVISNVLRKCAKSKIFCDLVDITESESYNTALWAIMRNSKFDSSILAAIGSCGPSALIGTIIDRARKNELLINLVGIEKRRRLLMRNRFLDYKRMQYAYDLARKSCDIESLEYVSNNNAVTICSAFRARYYEFLNVVVINHTVPDPITCTVRVNSQAESLMTIKFKEPRSVNGDLSTKNMFDSSAGGRRIVHGKSRASVFSDSSLARAKNQCDRVLIEAAAVCAFVNAHGGDAVELWKLVKSMYGAVESVLVPSTFWRYDGTAATKRIGHLKTKRSHQICVYPNAASCIGIESATLESTFDAMHMSTDYMNYIAGYRSVMLIEYGCAAGSLPDLYFAWAVGARPVAENASFVVNEKQVYDMQCSTLSCTVNTQVINLFNAAMRNMVITCDAGDEHNFLGVTFSCGTVIAPNEAQMPSTTCITIRPAARIGNTISHPDIHPHRTLRSLRATIRGHAQLLGHIGAIMSTISGYYFSRYNGYDEDIFFTGRWADAGIIGSRAVDRPVEAYEYIRDAIGAEEKQIVIDALVSTDIGTRIRYGRKRALAFLETADAENANYAAGFYLWIAFGHYPAASMYALTARLGPEAVRRVHLFAGERYYRKSTGDNSEDDRATQLRSFLYRKSGDMVRNIRSIPAAAAGLLDAIFDYMKDQGTVENVAIPHINTDEVEVAEDFIRILDSNMETLIDVMRRFRSGKTVRAGRRQIDALCRNYVTITEILGDYTLMCAPTPSIQKLFVDSTAAASFEQFCVEMEEDDEPRGSDYYLLNECEAIDAYERGESAIAYEFLTNGDRSVNSGRLRNEDDDAILVAIGELNVRGDIA